MSVEKLDLECLGPMISYATGILGFEFDEDEYSRDYYLGGWIPKRSHFLSDVLFDLDTTNKDWRYLNRIFDYVTGTEDLGHSVPREVNDYQDNAVPLATAMMLTGKPSPALSSIVQTIDQREKFYRKLIDFERKPNGYVNLTESLWKSTSKRKYDNSLYSLCENIVKKVNCNIPPSLVKEYTNDYREFDIVNTSWIGFNELDMPNRIIKSICSEVSKGNLKSGLELPMRDSWEYASLEFRNGLPDYIVDFPFVLIAKGEIRNISPDGFSSLGNHIVDFGKIPKSLMFNLPKREIPRWRNEPDLLLKPVRPIEELEDELGADPMDLILIGVEVLHPVQIDISEQVEEESIEEESDDSEPFDDERIFAGMDPETLEPIEYIRRITEDAEKASKIDSEPAVDPIANMVWDSTVFTTADWVPLSKDPSIKSRFTDIRCDLHKDNEIVTPDAISLRRNCLACCIIMMDPFSEGLTLEDRSVSEDFIPRDKLLRLIGLHSPVVSEDEDGDDAFDMFA